MLDYKAIIQNTCENSKSGLCILCQAGVGESLFMLPWFLFFVFSAQPIKEVWYGPAQVSFELSVTGSPYDGEANDVRVEFADGAKKESRLSYFDGSKWRCVLLSRSPGSFQATVMLNGKPVQTLSEPVVLKQGSARPFVRLGPSKRGFVTADGKPYWPIGHNLAWQSENLKPDLEGQLALMGQNGCNWARIWASRWDGKNPWSLNNGKAAAGRDMLPEVMDRWDRVVEAASKAGVKFQFVLFYHGAVSSKTDANWNVNPWNVKNGGFLSTPEEFFTHSEAIARTKNWLRYAVARWGHEPSIMAWELFNEVEWVDAIWNGKPETVGKWHDDMAAYLRSVDPYRHLVTTSARQELPIWKEMDYLQPHGYPPDVGAMVLGTPPSKVKPLFYGEVGGGDGRSEENQRKTVRDALWNSLLAGHSGAAQYWYWDRVIQMNLYPEFERFSRFVRENKLAEGAFFEPVNVVVESRKASAITFAPGRGWAPSEKFQFQMPEDAVNGSLGKLSGYFQGTGHREMMPEPIRFTFESPAAGRFEIKVGTVAKAGAKMRIELDGTEKVSENWNASDKDLQANKNYAIDFPAGKRTVAVSSEGPDWFTVDSVRIDGIGNAVSGSASKAGDRILLRLNRSTSSPEPYLLRNLPAAWRQVRILELDLDTGKVQKRLAVVTRGTPVDASLTPKSAALLLTKFK